MYQNIPRGRKSELGVCGDRHHAQAEDLGPGCRLSPTSAVLPGPASHPPQSLVYSPPRQFQKQEQSACLTLSHQGIKHWYSQNVRTGWQKSMVHNVVCEEWCGKNHQSCHQNWTSSAQALDLHTKFCLGKGTDGSNSVKADWLSPLLATCFPRGFGCVI